MVPSISNVRYVLISPQVVGETLYYGPFVSIRKAEEYRDGTLDLETGAKAKIKILLPRQ